MDSDSPRAWFMEPHTRKGRCEDIHIKSKSYKLELLEELIV